MSNHLTEKEIDYYVSGLASAEDVKRAEEHVSVCSQCRRIVDLLSSVVAEQPSDSIPGEHVKEAVIAEWHRLHGENAGKDESARPQIKRLIAGFAVAASVAAAFTAYLFFGTPEFEEIYPLTISYASGEVYINDSVAVADTSLTPGSSVKTGNEAYASISSEGYTLYLGSLTSLKVEGNSRTAGISFRLGEGSVISKSSGAILYRFDCGEYRVVPAGTEFMLKYSAGKLEVAVSQGKVSVAGSGLQVEISAGEKWSSVKPGTIETLDKGTSPVIRTGITESRPFYESSTEETKGKTGSAEERPAVKSEDGRTETGHDTRSEEREMIDVKKEKLERMKLDRELHNDMNDMKREQKRERNGRNRG